MLQKKYPFELPPLPYAPDALEPFISQEILHYHHGKHFAGYIEKLNHLIETCPPAKHMTLKQLICNGNSLPVQVRQGICQNAGGTFNHDIYFKRLGRGNQHPPQGLLAEINRCFQSYDNLKKAMNQCAAGVFGSGWAFLIRDPRNILRVVTCSNQDVPTVAERDIILAFDVWEHAYYLQYKNKRAGYLENIWNVVSFSS